MEELFVFAREEKKSGRGSGRTTFTNQRKLERGDQPTAVQRPKQLERGLTSVSLPVPRQLNDTALPLYFPHMLQGTDRCAIILFWASSLENFHATIITSGKSLLLRGAIVNRTYGTHKNLYIYVFLPTIFGPINYGPP